MPFRSRRRADPEPRQPAGHRRRAQQREFVDAVNDLNRARLDATGDPEIATRIAAYEMAYRMQTERPGADGPRAARRRRRSTCTASSRASRRSPTTACWPAGWSSAACGSCSSTTPTGTTTATPATNLGEPTRQRLPARSTRPAAALVHDLKQRGLLDDTLVVWGGEFGRTPMGEAARHDRPRPPHRRLHHVAGRRRRQAAAQTIGETDELGFDAVEDQVHVHDLHATILHLLGLDHTKLTYRFQGRDFRLTDVHGNVVQEAAGVATAR